MTARRRREGRYAAQALRQFRTHTSNQLGQRFDIVQTRPDETFERIAKDCRTRVERLFVRGFTYVQAVDTHDPSCTHVTKCMFDGFFHARHSLEVVHIFGALESVRVVERHRPRDGTRFARLTTLARGANACR